jgi:hypothetical protein
MLEVLQAAEQELPRLLDDEPGWSSMYIDYHRPGYDRMLWIAG